MTTYLKRIRGLMRDLFQSSHNAYLRLLWGYQLHPTTLVSLGAYLDKTAPELISIGAYTIITRGAVVLSHDFSRALARRVTIGANTMIGVNAIVLPGITIGDSVVVGAGSVVNKDIPSNSIAVGNPARVVGHIATERYGRIIARLSNDDHRILYDKE